MMNKNVKNKIQKKKYKQQINFFYNSDIDKRNIDKKNMIRLSIVKFLSKSGELTAAKFVSKELSFSKKLSEINDNKELTKESKRISLMDSKIVNLLGQIKSELQSQKKSNKQSSTQSVKTNDNKKPSNSLQRSNNLGQKNDKQTNIKISGNGELLINGKSVGKIKSNSEKLENKKDINANNKTENKPEEKNSKPVNTDEKSKDKKSKPEKTSSANNKFTEDRLKKIRKVTDLTKYKDIKVNTKKEQNEKDKLLFQMDEENKKIRKERQEKARRYRKLEDRLLLRELENEEIENKLINEKDELNKEEKDKKHEKIKEKDELNKEHKKEEKDKKHEKIQDKKINISDKTFNERVKAADEKNSQRDKLGNKITPKKEKGFLSKLLKTPKNGSKIDRKLQEFKERKKLSSLNPANKIIYKTGIGARNIGSNLATAGSNAVNNAANNAANFGLNFLGNILSDGKMIAGAGAAALTGIGRKMLIRTGGGALVLAGADLGYNLYKRWNQSDFDKERYGKVAANVTAALAETSSDIIDTVLSLVPHGEEFGKKVSQEMMDLFGIKETENIKKHGIIAGVIDDLKKEGFGFTKEEMIDYLKSGIIKENVEKYMSGKYDKLNKYLDSPEFQKDLEDTTGYKKTLAYDNYLKMKEWWENSDFKKARDGTKKTWEESQKEIEEMKKKWDEFNLDKWTDETLKELTKNISEIIEVKIPDYFNLDNIKKKFKDAIKNDKEDDIPDDVINKINEMLNNANKTKDETGEKNNRFIYNKIISYTKNGDYKVIDWNKVFALQTNGLLELLKISKLNKDDADKIMKEVNYRNMVGVKAIDNNLLTDKSIENVGLSNEDILATNLYIAKTEYDQFQIDNPFTKENTKEVTVKLSNGKSTKETRYKDDGTQETYLRLKAEYDDSYKKYLELRRQQIDDMSDEMKSQLIYVQGEKLTPEQFKDWSNNSKRFYGDDINNYFKGQAAVKGSSNVFYNKLKLDNVTSKDAPDTSGMGGIMAYIKAKESFKPYAYDDNGHQSIGYGHQIIPGDPDFSGGITREEADKIFAEDFPKYLKAAQKIPGYDIAPKDVQDALVDMTYNMGTAWYKNWTDSKGQSTISANLQKQDYNAIVESIKGSKYATQVGVRARENIARFLKGAEEIKNGKKIAETPATQTSTAEIKLPETENTQSQTNVNKPDGSKKLGKDDATNSKMNNDQKVEENSKKLEQININLNSINIINKNDSQTNVQQKTNEKQNEDKGLLSTFVL